MTAAARSALDAGRGGAAAAYAAALLASLELPPELPTRVDLCEGAEDPDPDVAWARSGAMALTGTAEGSPLPVPFAVASCAAGAARALGGLASLSSVASRASVDGAALLGERAALDPRLRRGGTRSVGGSARLLACADGWLALNLARPDDRALLPAWLEREPSREPDAWTFATEVVRDGRRDDLVARGRGMGLAVSPLPRPGETPWAGPWQRIEARAPARPRTDRPLVVDLSSLWAGPLCGDLLAACGARVVKVESLERPDGARRGERAFFDRLNGEKESVALPLREARGRRALAGLIARADVVIESSRPRALEQLGIHAAEIVERHGTSWIAITGYGRRPPGADHVAFGDDAAVAAGLVAHAPDGSPLFCGDAIADPLAGLHAAVAALAALAAGEARLADVSLCAVAAHVRGFPHSTDTGRAVDPDADVTPPRARPVRASARPLGADTARVLAELGIAC